MHPDRASLSPTLAVLLCAVLVSPANALESDAGKPIEIEADSMTLDQATGLTEYRGKVRLSQGSIHVSAERLTLHSENGRVMRMEMVGGEDEPAVFEQQTEDGGLARGRARRIEYNADRSRLILQGDAELRQGPNHIRSGRIDYNTLSNSLLAGGKPAENDAGTDGAGERVQITIESGKQQPSEQQ